MNCWPKSRPTRLRRRRGTLKVFFGYAAGVGKTYTMLETAAGPRPRAGTWWSATSSRTAVRKRKPCWRGWRSFPFGRSQYRGVSLREFDVDAALARRPDLLLVDELAHTNAEGSRHAKRWQDVEELLAAGIHVWTTLNVQHIESLNDVIGQVTGVTVRETVPDQVFDSADDLELVDISPEDLLARLQAGKVYIPQQAERAMQSFFQKANLVALRELSFRHAAQRIHTRCGVGPAAAGGHSPLGDGRAAAGLRGAEPDHGAGDPHRQTHGGRPRRPVDRRLGGTGRRQRPACAVKEQIAQHFRLAERLGAETVTLAGQDVAGTILDYARSRATSPRCSSARRTSRAGAACCSARSWTKCWRTAATSTCTSSTEKKNPGQTRGPGSRPVACDWLPYLHAGGAVAVSSLVAALFAMLALGRSQCGHGLPGRRRLRGLSPGAWAGDPGQRGGGAGVRLLLRSAATHVCRRRHAST